MKNKSFKNYYDEIQVDENLLSTNSYKKTSLSINLF